jgi:putative transposase
MSILKHRTAPHCTYFVTTKAFQSTALFQVHATADILVSKLFHYRDTGAYQLHAFVVMPNHLHVLLTPTPTTSLEKAMQLIKGGSSYEIRNQRGSRLEIWQPGFHEETVRDEADFLSKFRYIEQNPVAARLIDTPADWPWGSACGHYKLDPIPQRLKPVTSCTPNVGAKAPTS